MVRKRYDYVHEAIAAAVRRRFPALTVTSDYPPTDINGWVLDITGGTKAERDAAMEWARKFAEGWTYKPG